MKQLVTISSGSILVMIAFLDKVLPTRQWALLVAVHCGLLDLHYCELANDESISLHVGSGYQRDFQSIERPAYRIALWSFLLAIAALVAFVTKNLVG